MPTALQRSPPLLLTAPPLPSPPLHQSRVPGDYGFDPLKLMKEGDPDEYALKEITHCRLAMLAVGGMITQCGVTGTGLYGHTL